MEDIVERLRKHKFQSLLLAAADEIERLRSLAVTPDQQAVLIAAEAWRIRRAHYVMTDLVQNDLGGTSWALIAAVDASRAPGAAS